MCSYYYSHCEYSSFFPLQDYTADPPQQPKWGGGNCGQPSSGPQVCPRQPVHKHRAPGDQTWPIQQLRGDEHELRSRGEGRGVHVSLHGRSVDTLQSGRRRVGEGDLRTEPVRSHHRQPQLVHQRGPAESTRQSVRRGERCGEKVLLTGKLDYVWIYV